MTLIQGLTAFSEVDHSKPWLVSGSGRSGTTVLVRLCAELGLKPFWNQAGHAYEFHGLTKAHQNLDFEWIREFRTRWTAGCVVKIPTLGVTAGGNLELAQALDCNYLFSLRDAVSESFYDGFQHPDAHRGELVRIRSNMNIGAVSRATTLSKSYGVVVLSYEKLIQPRSNEALITELCRLIGGDTQRIGAALALINPEDEAYRSHSPSPIT